MLTSRKWFLNVGPVRAVPPMRIAFVSRWKRPLWVVVIVVIIIVNLSLLLLKSLWLQLILFTRFSFLLIYNSTVNYWISVPSNFQKSQRFFLILIVICWGIWINAKPFALFPTLDFTNCNSSYIFAHCSPKTYFYPISLFVTYLS